MSVRFLSSVSDKIQQTSKEAEEPSPGQAVRSPVCPSTVLFNTLLAFNEIERWGPQESGPRVPEKSWVCKSNKTDGTKVLGITFP